MGIFAKQKVVNRVVLLDVDEIASNPYQPRRQFDPKAMRELADSIRQNGLLQPVTVRQNPMGGFELIAGERRLMACKMIGKEKIPAIVESFNDEKSAVFALIENLQRKDLNYFEEAAGIQQLMQHGGMTQQQVAERLGKAQSTVANKLRLLTFSEELRRKMLDSGLTERHARALLKLPDEQSVELAMMHIISQRLNVGESERYIDSLLEPDEPQEQHPKSTRLFVVKDLRIFMNTISKAVTTMKLAGIEIDTCKEEDENYINYTMRIPKKSAYRTHSA
ncbi:ParB/RepB/Spo0J family partition protein [Anaerotruncus rubiinfantis]|uniref:ParB/RepB/Spo0J family partition protein n=1 Tax=Anaerotruncus rubiinfantis TaxID=1720200 RepID=UPI0034A39C49